MPTAVRSYAKINLGLGIGAPRPDGFHALVTVYQTLEMHDLVTVTARRAEKTSIRLTSNDERVPTDERNTAWKMISLALEALKLSAEVSVHIEKRLPVQGGLGAGSANAVAALIGLETELGLASHHASADESRREHAEATHPMSESPDPSAGSGRASGHPAVSSFPRSPSARDRVHPASHHASPEEGQQIAPGWPEKRLEIAAQVGSDVPLFLIGGTILGLDRGQKASPLPDIEPTWCVVAIPDEGVSTAQAFRDWDALCAAEGLTPEASTDKLNELSRAYAAAFQDESRGVSEAGSSGVISKEDQYSRDDLAGPLGSALVRTGITSWIENDFERVVFPQHPSLSEIKRTLAAEGTPEAAVYASLSGSGSALYGLYLAREHAEAACRRLNEMGVRSELTRTLPRTDYWRQMLSE